MTEKVKRYMDFMGPAQPRPARRASGDPLATRPASRAIKSAVKPVASSVRLSSSPSTLKSPAKPAMKSPLKTTSPAKASDDLALKAAAALSGANLKQKSDAPDGNSYSLGGKSPFLSSYNIEKRPLGDKIKEKKVEEIPKKNIYKREETVKKSKKSPTVIIDEPKKSSGLSTFIIILLTIILGAAVGAGVYFLFFK